MQPVLTPLCDSNVWCEIQLFCFFLSVGAVRVYRDIGVTPTQPRP
jgi:hypothetical protein